MWNPDVYRDTDYGLEPDETYEPPDDLDEDFVPDEDEPYMQTVLGPVGLDEVGVTLVHEHLQWDSPSDNEAGIDGRLIDRNAALLDLEAFFSVGGRTLVSATPPGAGRCAQELIWLAQHAPVHIVGASGFNGQSAIDQRYGEDPEDNMRAELAADFTEGMDGTAAQPGILVVSTEGAEPSEDERSAIELVSEYQQRSHVPVLIETGQADGVLRTVDYLVQGGVHPVSVIVAVGDQVADLGQLRAIADTGSYLSFDDLGSSADESDRNTADLVSRLVQDGYGRQILLSHNFRRRSLLTGYSGRPGYPYIVEQFAIMLLEAGLQALDVRDILVDNTARALAVRRPAQGIPVMTRPEG